MFAVISIYQLEQMLSQGQRLLLIDLRTEAEYRQSHLQGAVNIPYDCLEEGTLTCYRDIPLLFYCTHGGKSMQAARELSRRGWHAASQGSGIQYYHGKYLVSG